MKLFNCKESYCIMYVYDDKLTVHFNYDYSPLLNSVRYKLKFKTRFNLVEDLWILL